MDFLLPAAQEQVVSVILLVEEDTERHVIT